MKENKTKIAATLAVMVSILIMLIGVFFIPQVFESVFAIDYLLNFEIKRLTITASVFVSLGVLFLLFRKRIHIRISLIVFGLTLLLLVEFGFRAVANLTLSGAEKWSLEIDGLRTYNDYTAYTGHPFLQFTKRGLRDLSTNEFKNPYEHNSLGFNDIDRPYKKPSGEYRIAAIGASTTERGYPQELNKILNTTWTSQSNPVVLNFGVSSWTSAHSMINYMLNVVEFEPDMLIIHHGWNESEIRNSPKEDFRPDYAHAFKYFHEPERKDALIVRTSLLYRWVKKKLDLQEGWMFLDRATMKRDRVFSDANFSDTTELRPYKRNIKPSLIKL